MYNMNTSAWFAMDVSETYLLYVSDGAYGRRINPCVNTDRFQASKAKRNPAYIVKIRLAKRLQPTLWSSRMIDNFLAATL